MPLTANEKKQLLQRVGWDEAITNYIESMQEAQVYILAGLRQAVVGGRPALIRMDIRWWAYNCQQPWLKEKFADYDRWVDYNNADLIGEGYPPRDDNGDPYVLHHIGQRPDAPLAELSYDEHIYNANNTILHQKGNESEADRQRLAEEKSQHWQARYKMFTPDELEVIYKNH